MAGHSFFLRSCDFVTVRILMRNDRPCFLSSSFTQCMYPLRLNPLRPQSSTHALAGYSPTQRNRAEGATYLCPAALGFFNHARHRPGCLGPAWTLVFGFCRLHDDTTQNSLSLGPGACSLGLADNANMDLAVLGPWSSQFYL